MHADATDAELLLALRTDPSALAAVYGRHLDRVVRFAVRRCAQPADVADLVAQTFLEVLVAAPTYDPQRGDAGPWILGIAGRLHANRSRRRAREARATGRLEGRRLLSEDDVQRLVERIDAARSSSEVERAISGLPERHREVLWLVGWDGLEPTDAARVLGVHPATFRMRLTRARRALQQALEPSTTSPTPNPNRPSEAPS